jgi:hypothetical protein
MTRKSVAFPSARAPESTAATAWDPESWVFVDERGRAPAGPPAGADARDRVPAPGDIASIYLSRLMACRTPADLLALQLWTWRAQAEAGLALGSRYAQAVADAAAGAARVVGPPR